MGNRKKKPDHSPRQEARIWRVRSGLPGQTNWQIDESQGRQLDAGCEPDAGRELRGGRQNAAGVRRRTVEKRVPERDRIDEESGIP